VSDPAAVTAAPLEARYLFGSSTLSSGAFARAFTDPRAPLAGYLGLRGQLNRVVLPEDARLHELFAASAAPPPILPAADLWTPGFAAEAGLSYRPVEAVMLVLNLGSGFRSPNIDDYTRMGAEGPGFLVPGRDLSPEQSYTGEVGIRVSHPLVRLQAFYALTAIPGLTGNVPTTLDGQAFTPDGVPYLTRLNRERATIHAIDGSVEVTPVPRLALAASAGFLASAQVRRDLLAPGEPLITEPLSRQPPLNGTVKARFTPAPWLFAEGLVRWAAAQRAISSSDRLDNRICFEAPSCAGTPGYAAVHLRAGATIGQGISVGLSLLNLLDATYRVHGSGVDEPGRSVAASVEVRL
jgi:iron complex outermembrane receptor protein/hemoglobin/transferrin/lactoferrin receptor protein